MSISARPIVTRLRSPEPFAWLVGRHGIVPGVAVVAPSANEPPIVFHAIDSGSRSFTPVAS